MKKILALFIILITIPLRAQDAVKEFKQVWTPRSLIFEDKKVSFDIDNQQEGKVQHLTGHFLISSNLYKAKECVFTPSDPRKEEQRKSSLSALTLKAVFICKFLNKAEHLEYFTVEKVASNTYKLSPANTQAEQLLKLVKDEKAHFIIKLNEKGEIYYTESYLSGKQNVSIKTWYNFTLMGDTFDWMFENEKNRDVPKDEIVTYFTKAEGKITNKENQDYINFKFEVKE